MKKGFLLLIYCFSFLYADARVDGLKQRVCNSLSSLEGWCTSEKALNFIDLILEVKPDIYVEIGVFGGRSLLPVASALKFLNHGVVYAIDPWDRFEATRYYDPIHDRTNLEWWDKLNFNYIYSSYLAMLRKYDLERYCITLKMTSEKAVSEIDRIDILHIDGNHSEEGSIIDVVLYLPKVRSGGYIWMNDASWADRQEAVDVLAKECDVIKILDNGNLVLFRKR
ncbi:MAG: class I SAM-dependent methyltransferase [Verrucomicrobiota bacterium]|nr:class I SAM-dependent methyltransferase [Verrucomicrobiota bacterium]